MRGPGSTDHFLAMVWRPAVESLVTSAAIEGKDLNDPRFVDELCDLLNQQFADDRTRRMAGELRQSPTWQALWRSLCEANPELTRQPSEIGEEDVFAEALQWVVRHLWQFLDTTNASCPGLRFNIVDPRPWFEHLQQFIHRRLRELTAREQAAISAAQAAKVPPVAPPAPCKLVPEAERTRRRNATHQAELAFVDYAADVKGVFGLRDFELWRNASLGDDLPLDTVEANASAFSTLMKKYAVHRRLRALYEEFTSEVEESYSRDMLDNFIRTRLSVDHELDEVVAAAKELESRLVSLAERVKRDRALEKLKATKREMDKRAEGAEALAAAVGAMPIFDDGERQEMERMARDAADGTRKSVFDDLLKKETGDVTRAIQH